MLSNKVEIEYIMTHKEIVNFLRNIGNLVNIYHENFNFPFNNDQKDLIKHKIKYKNNEISIDVIKLLLY
jgi:hypothetical protein